MKGDIVREAKQGIPTPLLDGCHVLNVIFSVKTAAITLMNRSFGVYALALMYIIITSFIYTFLLTPVVFNGFDLSDFNYHILYAQKSPSNAHAHISIWASGLNFGLTLHLHPYNVNRSSKGSGKCVYMSEPSLLENAICTKILCAGSMIVFAGESGASTGVRTRCCNLV